MHECIAADVGESMLPHQRATVDYVLERNGAPVLLLAPPGSGASGVIVELCRDQRAHLDDGGALVVVRTRVAGEQYLARFTEQGVASTLVASDNFRLLLDEGFHGVLVVTSAL